MASKEQDYLFKYLVQSYCRTHLGMVSIILLHCSIEEVDKTKC